VDAKIIDIRAYDLVLSMDWLEQFGPMMCDWFEKWIQFQYKGGTVRLQGIVPSLKQELKEVSMLQLLKWDKGNDLWATVLIEPTSQPSTLTEQYIINGVPPQIIDLIMEFDQIFQEPSSLPPSRVYDHTIAITPNAAPANCRSYGYSSEQKMRLRDK
jgi:hypothetical protein